MESDDPYLRERLGLAVAERAGERMSEEEHDVHRWLEVNLGRRIEPWQARRLARVLQIDRAPR